MSKSNDQFSISVKIAERVYRLTIKPEEEEGVRKAAKSINEKIKEYSNAYAYNDIQDLLSMVALQFATRSVNFSDNLDNIDIAIGKRLEKLDKYLSDNIQ